MQGHDFLLGWRGNYTILGLCVLFIKYRHILVKLYTSDESSSFIHAVMSTSKNFSTVIYV